MEIDLNGLLTLGQGNFIIESVEGLGAADIRTSQFLFSGRDGGLVSDQYYGFRPISIAGKILSPTCEQHQDDRDTFNAAVPIGTTFPVTIRLFNGDSFIAYCNVTKPTLDFMTGGQMSDFLLQLVAGDPLFYNAGGGGLQSAVVPRLSDSGGYETPYILPVEWEDGGTATIVNNLGNAIFYPTITITDEAHDPIVTNTLTGEFFQLEISTLDGDELVIDMYNRTVKLNGSDVLGNKTAESTWWGLQPGANPITYETDTGTDDTTEALIEWRNGVTGI